MDLNPFTRDDINDQLGRILNCPLFINSPTLGKFLEYIVSETLDGRERNIKEYCIAVDVLNRPVDFNSHDDAVVRIHAGRLRRILNEYYLSDGVNDPIVIQVPKGGYIPEFKQLHHIIAIEDLTSPEIFAINTNPTVAIFPFKSLSRNEETDKFSLLLWEEMSAELSRFNDISVIGYYSMDMTAKINQNILEAGKLIGADYIITGSLQYTEQKMRIRINLLITETGEIVLTKTLDKDILSNLFEIQDEIITTVICAVAGYYGLIFQKMEKASPIKVNSNKFTRKGIQGYYEYERVGSMENYHAAVLALEQAVKANPEHALSWAMLGEIYLDAVPLLANDIENPIEKGYNCAKLALKIDPLCQHGWHVLTWAYLIKKDRESCLYAGIQCINLNPNFPIMVAGAALMLICAGYFDEGFPVMEKSIKKSLYYPWWMNMGFIFYLSRPKKS